MMKRKAIYYFLLFGSLLFSSCIYDEEVKPETPTPGEILINLNTVNPRQTTRGILSAVSENHVADLYMLIYDTNGKYLKYKKATKIVNTNTDGNEKTAAFPLETDETLANVRLRFFANVDNKSADFATKLAALTVGSSMIDTFNPTFNASTAWNTTSNTNFDPMPMWGGVVDTYQLRNDDTVTLVEGTNSTVSVQLMRATARINVTVQDATLKVVSVDVYNTLSSGYVASTQENLNGFYEVETPYVTSLTETSTQFTFNASTPYSSSMANSVYVAETENKDTRKVAVVVGVTDGTNIRYSRLDFINNDGDLINVLRNHSYTFKLQFSPSGILTGYETKAAAFAHKTENMTYTLDIVNDAYHNIMVTDDCYLLCLNADEFTVPTSGGSFDFVVFTTLPHIEGYNSWQIDQTKIKVNGSILNPFTGFKVCKQHDPNTETWEGIENYNYYLTCYVPSSEGIAREIEFEVCATDKIKWKVKVHQRD